MDRKAIEFAKEKLKQVMDVEVVEQILINRGYSRGDVERIVGQALFEIEQEKAKTIKRRRKDLSRIEFLDRLAFGMGSIQYINVFAFMFGANLFFIGLIHSIISSLQLFLTFITESGNKLKRLFNPEISKLFAIFSLILMGYFAFKKNFYGLLIGLIFYSLFMAFYSTLLPQKNEQILKIEKRGFFLRNISWIGAIITSLGIYISGWLLDSQFSVDGRSFIGKGEKNLLGFNIYQYKSLIFKLSPFAVLLWSVAFLFLVSLLILLKYRKEREIEEFPSSHTKEKLKQAFNFASQLWNNKVLFLLFLGSSISFVVSLLINSYLGIFIYLTLRQHGLGAFRNIAIVFIIAILSSFIGPFVVRKNAKEIGKLPLLIFGSLLSAILPLALFFNKSFLSIALATLLGILGYSISESAQGFALMDLFSSEIRKHYYDSIRVLLPIPAFILTLIGAFIAFSFNLRALFLILAIIQAGVVFPIYFFLLVMISRKKVIL